MKTFQFQASLEETSLPDMFATVLRHKVPGVLEISRDEIVKRIFIDNGSIIHASSNDRTDRLGAHLYRSGLLTRQQLAETMREREGSGKLHGQLLIEGGLLSPADLYAAIRGQVESIVWSVFSWQSGELTFRIGQPDDPVKMRIYLPLRQAILRGIKQVTDQGTKMLVARLGKKSTIFRPSYFTEDLIEVALNAEEYAYLRQIDGQTRFFDLCNGGPFSVKENARLIYAFFVLGLISKVPQTASQAIKIQLDADRKVP